MRRIKFDSYTAIRKIVRCHDSSADACMLVETADTLQKQMTAINTILDEVTDPLLIDSFSYELKGLELRYQYISSLCKECGVTVDFA